MSTPTEKAKELLERSKSSGRRPAPAPPPPPDIDGAFGGMRITADAMGYTPGPSSQVTEPDYTATQTEKLEAYLKIPALEFMPKPPNNSLVLPRTSMSTLASSEMVKTVGGAVETQQAGWVSMLTIKKGGEPGYPKMVFGVPKESTVGKGPKAVKKFFSDVAIKAENGNTTIVQMVMGHVVVVGMNEEQRRDAAAGAGDSRRSGRDYFRVGLPKCDIYPIMSVLIAAGAKTDSITETDKYYWMSCSWGVSNKPCKFYYKSDGSYTTDQVEMHQMLGGRSSLGFGSFGISIQIGCKVEGAKVVPDATDVSISLKLYSFTHMKVGDWSSGAVAQGAGFSADSSAMRMFGYESMEELAPVAGAAAEASSFFGGMGSSSATSNAGLL